jgi:transcriptional regulator with XRE-family HTH domain
MKRYPNIKLLRLRNNYKQEYVADALGMSQPEYSKLESGARKLDAAFLSDLCLLYDVSSDVFLNETPLANEENGNAYVRHPKNATGPHGALLLPGMKQNPNDVIAKMMENYTYLLDGYLKQQKMQEQIIEKFIRKMSLDNNADNAAQPQP